MDAEQLIKQTSEAVRSALEAAQRRANEIVREAEAEAQRIRGQAEAEARERLDQVRQALERLEAGLGAGSAPRQPSAEATQQAAEAMPQPQEPESDEREPEPAAPTPHLAPRDDAGAARLVAMKLALDGASRDEARKQLAADYEVEDLDSLLDEVYAKAGK
jgi:cell division septum initiation protein DivIVA